MSGRFGQRSRQWWRRGRLCRSRSGSTQEHPHLAAGVQGPLSPAFANRHPIALAPRSFSGGQQILEPGSPSRTSRLPGLHLSRCCRPARNRPWRKTSWPTARLMVWNSTGTLSRGSITIERCIGPVKGMNCDGIAVWVKVRTASIQFSCRRRWLLRHADPVRRTKNHGADCFPPWRQDVGQPPGPTATHPRVPFSFGHGNTHKHPANHRSPISPLPAGQLAIIQAPR